MSTVRRFWIEFERDHGSVLWWGKPYAGVTGFDEQDCLAMVADLIPSYEELPPVRRITVDISLAQKLPANLSNIGVPVWRGVWYPSVNLRIGPTWHPRGVSRAINPSYEPTTASELLRTKTKWWNEIPHINRLLFPLVIMHSAGLADEMRRIAPKERELVAANSVYGAMVREALDYMIARRPTPSEWFDPTQSRFSDQRELDEYLRAFRDYLFGNRPEPLYPPSRNRPTPDTGPDGEARDSGRQNVP
ncbi:hypothetical protein ACFYT3_35180 [Nocardia amikacinitolerans]|uniref:hypothetical protein n=1 Tax=Nocardia amikacinitolerans TaxID=756689 RepID=UPI0020A434D4|nr:hypothetical protein [Nocardia amikacinitolerans]MCP2293574.1 hypothetical protein [Nocardia amikacinitolerans]